MLVLTRREGEEVVLSRGGVELGTVRLSSIRGDRVRLAFQFDRGVEINRREVMDAVEEERVAGSGCRVPAPNPDPETRDPVPGRAL